MGITAERVYRLLRPLAKRIFYNKFNIEEGDYVLPDEGEPFILVGHHVSAFDPIIVNGFSRRLIRFLYADANDAMWARSFMLKTLDMIPFSKNSADFKSIRQIKKRLKEGQAIGLYPEGGATWDGVTEPVIFSTSKLLKMMGVPVYGVKYRGAYLSKPRWCKETRKGKVIMDTYAMFTADELKAKTAEEIHQELVSYLQYNEFEWQNEARVPFKGKDLAESIEKLLYYCPECRKFNLMTSKGDRFHCKACGVGFSYTEFGEILDDQGNLYKYQIPEWNKMQRSVLRERLVDGKAIEGLPLAMSAVDVTINGVSSDGHWKFDPFYVTNEEKGIKIKLSDVKSNSITFNRVIKFNDDQKDYKWEVNDGCNVSIKLMYDCITLLKED